MKKGSDLRIPFTWENRRPIILDRALYIPGHYDRHEEWGQLDWSSADIFGNNLPVIIEFCCGNGQWLAAQAKAYPEWNWVGVDKLFARARKAWAAIHRESLPNAFVICAEAKNFIQNYVSSSSIFAAHINFPDPWPKLRHAKHRLISQPFLQELSRILQPHGFVAIATDDMAHREWTLSEFSSWRSLYPSPGYVLDLPHFGYSFFRDLWTRQGKNIYHLKYTYGR